MMRINTLVMAKLSIVVCLTTLGACDFGPNIGNPFRPVESDSPGGIWMGLDSDGAEVLAFVGEGGGFELIGDVFNRGFGIMVVSNGNDISGNFFVTPEYGFTLPDETTGAECSLSGTVTQRQTMTMTVDCTTTAGLQNQTTLTLIYDALYERDSSLAAIAGNYDDGAGNVLNITADGTIFEQDAGTDCVTNGDVVVYFSSFNMYLINFEISNCMGQDVIFNDSSFSGLATLDNTVMPEQLIVAVSGNVAGTRVSFVTFLERL